MSDYEDHGLDFIGGFFMLAGALWVLGAVSMLILAMLGHGRVS